MNFGIIGAGNIFWTGHLPILRTLPQTHIVAGCDIDAGALERMKEELNVEHTFGDYRHMGDLQDVDIVIVSTPTKLNADIVEHLAAAGKHILVEKPLATTMADARRIVKVSEHCPVKLCVGHQRRFFSTDLKALSLIRKGIFGRLLYVQLNFGNAEGKEWVSRGEGRFFDIDLWGGGLWMQWGVHFTDLLLYLTGCSPEWISADINSRCCPVPGFDDDATALISLRQGPTGVIMISALREPICSLGGMEADGESVFIQGTEGCVYYGRGSGAMLIKTTSGTERLTMEAGEQGTFTARMDMYQRFLASIEKDEPSPVPAGEAANALELTLAGYESARTHHKIKPGNTIPESTNVP